MGVVVVVAEDAFCPGGRGRWRSSKYKASLVYRPKFEDSQDYAEQPSLEKQNKTKTNQRGRRGEEEKN